MRRVWVGSLLAALALSAGCGGGGSDTESVASSESPSETSAPSTTLYPSPGTVGAPPDDELEPVEPAGGVVVIEARNETLEGVLIRGGVEFRGKGTLTVRGSVVEGGYGWKGQIESDSGGTVVVVDSTIRARVGFVPSDRGAVYARGSVVLRRSDVSGGVDGVKGGSGTVVEDSWIHDLRPGTGGHVDGIQLGGASSVRVARNRIEASPTAFDPADYNAAIWIAPAAQGEHADDLVIENNYLTGGLYPFKLHSGLVDGASITGVVVTRNRFGPIAPGGGTALVEGPSSEIVIWKGNTTVDGASVPEPVNGGPES